MMVKDTDKGRELMVQIEDLKKLLVAYQNGIIEVKGVFKFSSYSTKNKRDYFIFPRNSLFVIIQNKKWLASTQSLAHTPTEI